MTEGIIKGYHSFYSSILFREILLYFVYYYLFASASYNIPDKIPIDAYMALFLSQQTLL